MTTPGCVSVRPPHMKAITYLATYVADVGSRDVIDTVAKLVLLGMTRRCLSDRRMMRAVV